MSQKGWFVNLNLKVDMHEKSYFYIYIRTQNALNKYCKKKIRIKCICRQLKLVLVFDQIIMC